MTADVTDEMGIKSATYVFKYNSVFDTSCLTFDSWNPWWVESKRYKSYYTWAPPREQSVKSTNSWDLQPSWQ